MTTHDPAPHPVAHPVAGQAGRPFVWPVRVYWEDTDAGGVVFYANHLRYMERARTEWLRALGFGQEAMRRDDAAMFVVTDTTLRYRLPARLDDPLDVTVELSSAGRASLVLDQQVRRPDGTVLVEGRIRIGCIDAATLRPRRIPTPILSTLGIA